MRIFPRYCNRLIYNSKGLSSKSNKMGAYIFLEVGNNYKIKSKDWVDAFKHDDNIDFFEVQEPFDPFALVYHRNSMWRCDTILETRNRLNFLNKKEP